MFAPVSSSQRPTAATGDWASYLSARERLEARIAPWSPNPSTRAAIEARARRRLVRLGGFLRDLGNPQHGLPVVHVTGTSGKGSTAAAIAGLLRGAGLRVGLATSPYLQVATEKLQIDGSLIAGADLLEAVEVVERAESGWRSRTGEPRLSYAETWTALMLHLLSRAELDLAVVEVGAGGRFDPTNVVEPVACVLTNIGLDHVESLGPTLADIAWHKAGIIKTGAVALTGERRAATLAIIAGEAHAVGCELRVVEAEAADSLADPPPHARANAALARATVAALAERGFVDRLAATSSVPDGGGLPGRFELMPRGASTLR